MTVEEKIRLTLGSLVVENIALNSKVEELNGEASKLKAEIETLKKISQPE